MPALSRLVGQPHDMTNVLLSGLLRPLRRDNQWDARSREAHFQGLGLVQDLEDDDELGYVAAGEPRDGRASLRTTS
jgi:hypothetical protein